MTEIAQIRQWDMFEIELSGPDDGNPFVDVAISAEFRFKNRAVPVDGFYDGQGRYKVRFMPDEIGSWRFTTMSSAPQLDGQSGEFLCVEPRETSHGPVRVTQDHHFVYADGTPYWPIGTTCYVWNHQGDTLEEQTLTTLKESAFNKIRMCVFPKDYDFNKNEPCLYPYEGSVDEGFDFTRFNPAFFAHLEQRINDLQALGIEADLILFHPYDRWGFSDMGAEADNRYLRYVTARLASFPNVWWSFANEYDLMKGKSLNDWDRFFRIVQEHDPAQHLRSIHNCRGFYDHGKPWVTHSSIQHADLGRVREWRNTYGKPVVVDECCYEGNIPHGWGNISARELVHRFWLGTAQGGYVGHGETYCHPEDILWWSKGGILHGDSPTRIAFLREILEAAPHGMTPVELVRNADTIGQPGEFYLAYLGATQPSYKVLALPDDKEFEVEIIDAWAMTVTKAPGRYSGQTRVDLPSRPHLALLVSRV